MTDTAEASLWVEDRLNSLSLDQLIAQMLNPILNCPWESSPTTAERLDEAIKYQTGSVFVAGDRPDDELRELIRSFAENSTIPPLINADIETNSILRESVRFGASMNLGAMADEQRAEELAFQIGCYNAAHARAIGINWALGPAVDLPFNYRNPMCGSRSYGISAEATARLANQIIRGLQRNGLAACLKHFPGDGTDDRDQHLVTPVNDLDFEQWQESYGKIFSSGIANGVYSIMIGHIALLARSSRDQRTGTLMPATLDPKIQIELLRGEMGFEGVIVSDAIDMGGIRSHCRNLNEAIVKNIASGSDVVLFAKNIGSAINAIKDALYRGEIDEKQLKASVRRILNMKAKLGLHDNSFAGLSTAAKKREDIKAERMACEIAEGSITLVRDALNDIPLQLAPEAKIVLCWLPGEPDFGDGILLPEQVSKAFDTIWVDQELKKRGYRVDCVADYKTLRRELDDADALIYISQITPEAGRGSIMLSRAAHSILKFSWDIINSATPVLFVSMGNPYLLRELPDLPNYICCYSNSPQIAEGLVKAIFGEIQCVGKMPVNISLF